jgi:hypothetical protein
MRMNFPLYVTAINPKKQMEKLIRIYVSIIQIDLKELHK